MATLAALRTRLLQMEGHDRSDDPLVALDAVNALNAAYRELCHSQPWFFTTTTESIVAASGYLILDPDTIHIIDVLDARGVRLWRRTRVGQIRYAAELSSSMHVSWSMDGYDIATNAFRLHLEPETAGAYTVRSAFMPDELVADSDEPLGPPIVGDIILWAARQSRLKEDEERQYLDMTAQQMHLKYLSDLQKMHAKLTREDGPMFAR